MTDSPEDDKLVMVPRSIVDAVRLILANNELAGDAKAGELCNALLFAAPASPALPSEAVAWRWRTIGGKIWVGTTTKPEPGHYFNDDIVIGRDVEVEPLYSHPVPAGVDRDEIIEMCAKVAEDGVRQKCCGRGRVVCDARGEPISEDCCGEPDLEPMYPNEIASSIRSLKLPSPETEEGK